MPGREKLPSTLKRSPAKAQRTWIKTHDHAVREYGEGERAHRTAFAALKHSFDKKGDRWVAKDHKGPSDPQARKSGRAARRQPCRDLRRGGSPGQHEGRALCKRAQARHHRPLEDGPRRSSPAPLRASSEALAPHRLGDRAHRGRGVCGGGVLARAAACRAGGAGACRGARRHAHAGRGPHEPFPSHRHLHRRRASSERAATVSPPPLGCRPTSPGRRYGRRAGSRSAYGSTRRTSRSSSTKPA